jgi:hypothetical protein
MSDNLTEEETALLAKQMASFFHGLERDDVLAALSYLIAKVIIDTYPARDTRHAMMKLYTDRIREHVHGHIDPPKWARATH